MAGLFMIDKRVDFLGKFCSLWVRVLFLYMVHCLYIQSLSSYKCEYHIAAF